MTRRTTRAGSPVPPSPSGSREFGRRAVTDKLSQPRRKIRTWIERPAGYRGEAAASSRSRRRWTSCRSGWTRTPDRAVGSSSEASAAVGLDALLAGLNGEQLRAVTHGEGPLLVVAGAGTGKTQVITRRIAWLIATRRARPSEILALTFTDKAADEMQARVDQLVPYGYTDAAVGHVPRVRGPRHPRVRVRARALAGRPRPVAPGDDHLPARAPVRVRARRLPAPRRPHAVPWRARDAVQPLQGRGHRPRPLPRPRGPDRVRGLGRGRASDRA